MQEPAIGWDVRSLFANLPLAMMAAFLVLALVPVINLLRRTGHNPVWCLLAIFPGVNVIAWWFFAFKSWPTDRKTGPDR
jgi:hypothetical protein